MSVDALDPPPHSLATADAELSPGKEAQSFLPPPTAVAEVTDDPGLTGGSASSRLAVATLLAWLAEHDVEPRQIG